MSKAITLIDEIQKLNRLRQEETEKLKNAYNLYADRRDLLIELDNKIIELKRELDLLLENNEN